jgi:hypothetical protein
MHRFSLVRRHLSRSMIALVALGTTTVTTWIVVGCSSSEDDLVSAPAAASPSPDAAPAKPNDDKGDISFPDAGKAEDETPKPEDKTCTKETTKEACMVCCSKEHAEGAKTRNQALLGCVCKADNCKTDCATAVCGSTPTPPDGGACQTCLQSALGPDGGCGQEVASACTSEDCKAFVTCSSACGKLQ